MARGQAGKSDKQLGITNAIGAQQGQEAQGLEDKLVPGYTSLMDTGYMSPEEEHAATTNEMGAATQPFESAKFEAGARAGATHNASDLTAQQDQLAMEEGRSAGTQAEELQKEKLQGQEAGMYGLAGQEAGNRTSMDAMYGLGPGTLGARAAGKSGDELAMGYINTATGQGHG